MSLLRIALVLALATGSAIHVQGQDQRMPFPPDIVSPAARAQRVRPAGNVPTRQKHPVEAKHEAAGHRPAPVNDHSAVHAGTQTALSPGQMPAVAPRFQLDGNKLTVIAPNSSMAEIIAGLRRTLQIPIEVEGGATGERVAAQIGPAPVRSVLLSLFDGSRYDYFILSSSTDPQMVSKVILTPKSGAGATQVAGPAAVQAPNEANEEMEQPTGEPEQPEQDEENPGFAPQENTPQPEQQNANPNNVKTPEQLLEELKQMEQQKQQQPDNQNRPQRPDRPQ